MIAAIIIEDQPPAQRILKKYIEDIGTIELLRTFNEATQAIEFLKSNKVDLMFLDIHLPKISGLDFLRVIPDPPNVILTTAFPDYALESYDLNVVDYLLKPFSFQRFVQAVSKVQVDSIDSGNYLSEIFIKSGYDHIKISIGDIRYIKSDADYTEIVVENRKVLSQEPLRHWLKTLSSDAFRQVHKSYIVNMQHIEKVSGNRVFLKANIEIPIGRAYKEEFLKGMTM